MLAGWAAAGSAPLRPNCSLAETQRQAFLRSGGWGTEDEAGYMRYCGPGRVVMQVDGRSLSIEGGSCSARRVRFGVLWNRVGQAPVGRGLWMLLEPGKRRGRIDIVDGEIQFPGVSRVAAPTIGTAIVAKGLMSATFTVSVGRATKVTGRWTCGSRT